MARANKETSVITVENFWDWMIQFDYGALDVIDFDSEDLDAFFSDWDTYVDQDNSSGSLKMDDIKSIQFLHVLTATDVKELKNLECDDLYDAVSYECELADKAMSEMVSNPPMKPSWITLATLHSGSLPILPGFNQQWARYQAGNISNLFCLDQCDQRDVGEKKEDDRFWHDFCCNKSILVML